MATMQLTEANLLKMDPHQNLIGPPSSIPRSGTPVTERSWHIDKVTYKFMVIGQIHALLMLKPEGVEVVRRSGMRLGTLDGSLMEDGSEPSDWKPIWEHLDDARREILKKRGFNTTRVMGFGPNPLKIQAWIPKPPDGPYAPLDDQVLTEDRRSSHQGSPCSGVDTEHEHEHEHEHEQEETIYSQVGRSRKRKRRDTSEAPMPAPKKRKLVDIPSAHGLKVQRYQSLATQPQLASSAATGRQSGNKHKREGIVKTNQSSPRLEARAAVKPNPSQQATQPLRKSARIAARKRPV
ncbi:hypothetical protein E4U41_000540 [Claviceps citrina]|nr:hypothetical protein E4U41_000540 [Claviceps citrina]